MVLNELGLPGVRGGDHNRFPNGQFTFAIDRSVSDRHRLSTLSFQRREISFSKMEFPQEEALISSQLGEGIALGGILGKGCPDTTPLPLVDGVYLEEFTIDHIARRSCHRVSMMLLTNSSSSTPHGE